MPDVKDREEIFKIHSQGKPLAKNVSLKKVAERTPGFSGADLANLMNEAAILAARRNKDKIYETEVLESIDRVLLGPERKSHILSEKEKKVVAYHEAGHALIAHFLPNCDPVQKVSILARGQAAGYTIKIPEREKYLKFKSEFLDNLSALLGGYIAEKEIFGEVTTGASNDLKEATKMAKSLATQFGMSELLGPRTFGDHQEFIFWGREITQEKDYSEKVAQLIDEEISKFISLCYNKATEVIKTKKDYLDKIAKVLLEKETIERKEFLKIFT
jgi:cell division protease FtsH